MPGHYNTGAPSLTPAQVSAGWTIVDTPAGPRWVNPKTNQTSVTPPLPAGWSMIDTPGGPRYVSETGDFSTTPPTEESIAPPKPTLSPSSDQPSGNFTPRGVVRAKAKKTKQVRTGMGTKAAPKSVLGQALVRKKTLMGS